MGNKDFIQKALNNEGLAMVDASGPESRAAYLEKLLEQTRSFMAVMRGPTHVFEFANEAYFRLVGRRDIVGKPLLEVLPEIKGQGFPETIGQVFRSGEPHTAKDAPVIVQLLPEGSGQKYVDFILQPLFDGDQVTGVFVEGHDVTDQVVSRQELIESAGHLKEQSSWLEHRWRRRRHCHRRRARGRRQW